MVRTSSIISTGLILRTRELSQRSLVPPNPVSEINAFFVFKSSITLLKLTFDKPFTPLGYCLYGCSSFELRCRFV